MVKKCLLVLLGFIALCVLTIGLLQNSSIAITENLNPSKDLHFDSEKIAINMIKNAVEAHLNITNPEKLKVEGTLYTSIIDTSGKVLTSDQMDVALNGNVNNDYKVYLPTSATPLILKNYRLKYTFKYNQKSANCKPNTVCGSRYKKIAGVKSIYSCYNHLAVKMLAQSQFISGAPASFRLVAFNPANNMPVNNANITVDLNNKSNNVTNLLFTGKTNEVGTINANFNMPEDAQGSYDLNIKAIAYLPEKAEEVINQPIQIKRDYKIMLSTDKPIYQPNQTMKIRSLALNTGTLKPVSEKPSTIEVYDAKGNKVFKKKTQTNKFGIISAEFTLADEVNMGSYKIKTIIDDIQSEKTVNVSRYVLPKYKIAIKTDKEYYLPSETVKGSVDVNYFFGKPVKDSKVKIKVDKFDIGFSRIEDITGITDNNGHFDFEVQLPDRFVGQNIAAGNAVVKFDVNVEDTAEHIEKKTTTVMVSQQAINIAVIPESGNLSKNIKNNVYIMTNYPDGTPAQTDIVAKINDKEYKIKTDTTGIATIEAMVDKENSVNITVSVKDAKGNVGDGNYSLSVKPSEESLILRTDKAIAKAGDTLKLQAITTKKTGTIYVDMIKNGQTVLTKSMDINSNKAEMAFDIPDELVGTLNINAYIINLNSEIVRDNKIVYVNPADDLNIQVNASKKVYKPAEDAVINFKVTDKNKHPILAALGVYVVDESVFALSELQPGLEKVFFTLEEEILKPRIEIHGITPVDVIKTDVDEKNVANNQQQAAKVLFAAAKELQNYTVNLDTNKDDVTNLANQYREPISAIINNLDTALSKYQRKHSAQLKFTDGLETLIDEGYLTETNLIDPWGNKIVVLPLNENKNFDYNYFIISKGSDGIAGTNDDILMTRWQSMILGQDLDNLSEIKLAFDGKKMDGSRFNELAKIGLNIGRRAQGAAFGDFDGRERLFAENEMAMEDKAMPAAVMKMAGVGQARANAKDEMPRPTTPSTGGGASKAEVRVRSYFPETLYDNPAIITDENGFASITIPMADSITTWRLSAMGNSLDGLLGSTTSGIRVFQDFFIDIDLPVALTENDKVSIPIAIYNYLPEKQTIKLEMEQQDWYKTQDALAKEVTLNPNEVSVEYFTIEVKKLGNHTLAAYAIGSSMSDAIKRNVRVEPDGEEFREAISGRLENNVTQTVVIPENSIDDASRILVKIYPGYLSQVVEGLDKIFRMPSGCFEQTSSTTYPNILVLDYMKRTKQITPEIQMKAESYINSGYQRLLTFEVDGGGFDWFGNPPANKILTAYGLMEFYDMSAVHDVDENLISRTQNWLVSKQEADGSWKPDEGGIAEGAINQYKDDVLRTTAYIGWALASSGHKGPALDKAVEYVQNNLAKSEDPYTCAVIANLMVLVDPESAITDKVFTKLISLKKEENNVIYWEQKEQTPMYGGGKSAEIETTALATIALINYGKEIGITNKALNYIIGAKDTFGTWHTTQATILSMKALLMTLDNKTTKVDATVSVSINGKQVDSYKIDEENSDVLKQVDLKNLTKKGKNTVNIDIKGTGSLLYQVVSIHYIPWDMLKQPKTPMLNIDVEYDKTTLEKNDMATAEVTIKNNSKDTANMLIADLGTPPGFEVQTEDLDKLVKDGVITKYSLAARQVILYFEKLKGDETVTLKYRVKAKISIKAQSGKSKVYKYYEPEVNDTSEPVEIKVI